MKIINAHVHMIEPDRVLGADGPLIPEGISVYKHIEESIPLLNPETVIAQMDDAGIDISVLFAVYAPILYSSNEYVKSLCNKYPNRLIGFASVNPKGPDAPEVLEKAINE